MSHPVAAGGEVILQEDSIMSLSAHIVPGKQSKPPSCLARPDKKLAGKITMLKAVGTPASEMDEKLKGEYQCMEQDNFVPMADLIPIYKHPLNELIAPNVMNILTICETVQYFE